MVLLIGQDVAHRQTSFGLATCTVRGLDKADIGIFGSTTTEASSARFRWLCVKCVPLPTKGALASEADHFSGEVEGIIVVIDSTDKLRFAVVKVPCLGTRGSWNIRKVAGMPHLCHRQFASLGFYNVLCI